MDEKPDQIIEHIEARRDELGRNLSELESKVRRTTDWRTYYDRNPMLIMGAALGGGLLLGAMIGGKPVRRSRVKTIRPYKPSATSGIAASSSSSAGYYTPSEPASQSLADLGASTGVAGSGSPSYSTGSGSSYSGAGTSFGTGSGSAGSAGNSQSSGGRTAAVAKQLSSLAGPQMHQVHEAWDHIRGALIAFGISKAKEFLSQAVPGIEQHLAHMGGGEHNGQNSRERSNFSSSGSYGTGSGNTGSSSQSYGETGSQSSGSGTGGGASDYRAGTQNYTGGSTSYGTGSSTQGGNSGPSSTSNAGTTNSGRASEADEYAGVSTGSPASPRNTTP